MRAAALLLGFALAATGGSGCGETGEPQAAAAPARAPEASPLPPAHGGDTGPQVVVRRIPPEGIAPAPRAAPPARPSPASIDPRLEDPDPERRIEALGDLEPEGEGLRQLGRLLARDPDPQVRAAAAEQLETSESPEAVEALLGALGDPAPRVVIAALEALEFVADERVVPELARWQNHPDPEVREALQDAIEFLE